MTLNKLFALTAVLTLSSFALVGCADPDADPTIPAREVAVASSEQRSDRALETAREPAPVVRAAVDRDRAVATTSTIDAPEATWESIFVEDCTGVWSCSSTGLLVLHREGTSCMLGDLVLHPAGAAEYREPSEVAQRSWHLEARTLYVPSRSDVIVRCERQD